MLPSVELMAESVHEGLRLSRSEIAWPPRLVDAALSYSARTVKTYAVKWREPDGQTFIGRLALGQHTLRLDGRRRGAEEPAVNRQFGYEELQACASAVAAPIGSMAARRSSSR